MITMVDDGYIVRDRVFDGPDLRSLRDGVEAAVAAATAAPAAGETLSEHGHRIARTATGGGAPSTSVHWEPGADPPVVRNLRPVTHLDERLARPVTDPRLTGPAAELLGTDRVALLSSKISYKRARVGSEYIWHQDHTFLRQFLGDRAADAVTVMVFLDDADQGNGALSLVPGSHTDGPRRDGEPPRPRDRDPVTLAVPAGGVVAFPTLMLHRSDANRSDRDRRALLYLFQPPGRPHLDESAPR